VEADFDRQRMRRAEAVVVNAVLAHIRKRYGWTMVDRAWAEFRGWEDRAPTEADRAEFEQLFLPWLVFTWVPDADDPDTPADWPRQPLALACLAEKPSRFESFERRFLEVACTRAYSFYAVTAVERGQGLTVRDLITRREHSVLERGATANLEVGHLLFTRVVPLDEGAIMVGSAPLAIPPTYRLRIVELREEMAAQGAPDEGALHQWDAELRETYLEIKDELHHPRLPQLQNTDGEPIVPTKLHFVLACSPREAFERLKSLALDASDEELLADAERDPTGELQVVRFPWLKRGNRMHRSWDNTILGTIAIEGRSLSADVNSERRAREIRAEVERRLGDRVAFRKAVTESIEAQLEAARRGRSAPGRPRERENERAELRAHPEVQEALRRFMAQHWESWLDEKIPALRFETPREAARTPSGRERLEALLAQFEWQGRHGGQPELGPDVAALRARLGL
jgi:hypothetical protein